MKAIQTKYLGATSTRPSRIKASAEGVEPITFTVEFLRQNGTPEDDPHITAAKCLAGFYGWEWKLVSGVLPGGSWAHCFIR